MGERQPLLRFAKLPELGVWDLWLYLLGLFLAGGLYLGSTLAGFTANLTQRSEMRDYRVYGKTARELVNYMRRRPFRGDNGPAMANIRPKYRLNMKTERRGSSCKLKHSSLDIRFVITLPKAMQLSSQSRQTRRAWTRFRAFTKRHEEVHRRLYVKCARRFLSKTKRLQKQGSCRVLKRHMHQELKQQEKDCDRLHLAFDNRDFPRVPGLGLFRQARLEQRRPARRTLAKQKSPKRGWWSAGKSKSAKSAKVSRATKSRQGQGLGRVSIWPRLLRQKR